MRLSTLILTIIAILIQACAAHVWIVEKANDAGVIAYQGSDNADFNDKYNNAVWKICRGKEHKVIKQRQNSSSGSYTYNKNQTSQLDVYNSNLMSSNYGQKIGTATVSQSVPVTQSYTEYWWEDTIKCISKDSPGNINSEEKSVIADSAPLPKKVIEMAKKCQVRGGIWVNDRCQIEIEDEEIAEKASLPIAAKASPPIAANENDLRNMTIEQITPIAESGNTEAQYLLGWKHDIGGNQNEAVIWYKKAAKSNHSTAKAKLRQIQMELAH